jgi:hypothetical protein
MIKRTGTEGLSFSGLTGESRFLWNDLYDEKYLDSPIESGNDVVGFVSILDTHRRMI